MVASRCKAGANREESDMETFAYVLLSGSVSAAVMGIYHVLLVVQLRRALRK